VHRNIGVGTWIARRAQMTPERTALVFGSRRYTYRELDDRIARLAGVLMARGLGRGDRVAFLGQNHPAALELLFAAGRIGAVAVPLHPGFDEQVLVEIVADAGPRILFFTEALAPVVARIRPAIGVERFVCVGHAAGAEPYEAWVAEGSDQQSHRPVGLDDLCLLAFSSGTTGRTKGVMLSHGNLLFNAMNLLCALDFVSDDVLLTSAPLYRMGGLGFVLPVFLKGGTCVLQEQADPERSLSLIARSGVTVLFDGPTAFEMLSFSPAFATADLSSIRIAITGGSHVPIALLRAFAARGIALQQGYGLTEAAPVALVLDREEVSSRMGAAGRPPLFGAARVVGPDRSDVSVGEIGELWVAGPNVMQGYWQAPIATGRALTEDGWLRTGDAATADADGTVSIVGRMVDALSLDGRILHPGPIESSLRSVPGVADAAIVQRRPRGTPAVFLVPDADNAIDYERVHAILRDLALYPKATLRLVPSLPRNPNGKVLRRGLRERDDRAPLLERFHALNDVG